MIESNARVDACGVCGGDESTCKHVHKSFKDSVKFGYHTIVTIPSGSTSILISEMTSSRNYLGEIKIVSFYSSLTNSAIW